MAGVRRRLRTFLRLSLEDHRLLWEALIILLAVRLHLSFASPPRVLGALELRAARWLRGRDRRDGPELRRAAWGVRTVARVVPHATCLTQALAARLLLARRGWRCTVRIGVRRTTDGTFRAHAWAERDGVVLTGRHQVHRYRELTDLSTDLPPFGGGAPETPFHFS